MFTNMCCQKLCNQRECRQL